MLKNVVEKLQIRISHTQTSFLSLLWATKGFLLLFVILSFRRRHVSSNSSSAHSVLHSIESIGWIVERM